jgi:hypothetical protein
MRVAFIAQGRQAVMSHSLMGNWRPEAEFYEPLSLDGEILAWTEERPLPFAALLKQIGRTRLRPRVLTQSPVIYMAFDVLEIMASTCARRRSTSAGNFSHTRASRAAVPVVIAACCFRLARQMPTALRRENKGPRGDAQTAVQPLWRGPNRGRVVEMEGAAICGRRGARRGTARPCPPGQLVHRLHVRSLAGRRAGAHGQSLFRLDTDA